MELLSAESLVRNAKWITFYCFIASYKSCMEIAKEPVCNPKEYSDEKNWGLKNNYLHSKTEFYFTDNMEPNH